MKKFLTIILAFAIIFCMLVSVHAEESSNLIDATNSGFEDAADVKSTKWYKLINAYGNSQPSDSLYTNITIKTDGGHTGNNYISMTAEMSWYSPSINIYPYIAEAGEDSYVISFWYKSNKSLKISRLLTRGLKSDVNEEQGVYTPDIVDAGNSNYYGIIKGSSTDPDENGWCCFVSETFDIVEEQLNGDHNWWFCLDQLPATSDAPLTLDIDDFVICPESEFEIPEAAEKKEISAELTYITDEVKKNVFPVAENIEKPTSSAPPIEITPIPEEPIQAEGMDIVLVIACSGGALLVCAALAFFITKLFKSKKN